MKTRVLLSPTGLGRPGAHRPACFAADKEEVFTKKIFDHLSFVFEDRYRGAKLPLLPNVIARHIKLCRRVLDIINAYVRQSVSQL